MTKPPIPKSVSLVVPIYNEALILPELTRRIQQVIEANNTYQWEVLYVNDGSQDGSSQVLSDLAAHYDWLQVLHLARNFGHQIAISAGIDYASGDAVILMDGDLQDPPELITNMLELWEQGYDVVYATRRHREGEGSFKKFTAAAYYRFLNNLAGIQIPLDTGDFRLMSRRVVNALSGMREKNRFIRGLVSWIGLRQTPIYYDRDARFAGETKYTLLKMTRFALDGILSFSKVPLQWITTLGLTISTVSFLGVLLVIYLRLFTQVPVETGWSSIVICILMLGGIQLVSLGMLGEYVGRIFDEVRDRPLYLLDKIEGTEQANSVAAHSSRDFSNES